MRMRIAFRCAGELFVRQDDLGGVGALVELNAHERVRLRRVGPFPALGEHQLRRRLHFAINPAHDQYLIAARWLHAKPVAAADAQVHFGNRNDVALLRSKPFFELTGSVHARNTRSRPAAKVRLTRRPSVGPIVALVTACLLFHQVVCQRVEASLPETLIGG